MQTEGYEPLLPRKRESEAERADCRKETSFSEYYQPKKLVIKSDQENKFSQDRPFILETEAINNFAVSDPECDPVNTQKILDSACKLLCGGKDTAKFCEVKQLFSQRKRRFETYNEDDELSACVSEQEILVIRSLKKLPEVSCQLPAEGHEVVEEPQNA